MSTPPSSTALIHIFSSKGLPDSLTYLPNSHQSYLTTMQIWLLLQSPTLPRKEGASSFTWYVRPSVILPLLTFPASPRYSLNTPCSFLSQCRSSFVLYGRNDLSLPTSYLSFKVQLKDHILQETSHLLSWVRGLSSIILHDSVFLSMHIITLHF